MNYTVRCFRLTSVKYRTEVVVLVLDESKAWEHIDRCPHGHEVKKP